MGLQEHILLDRSEWRMRSSWKVTRETLWFIVGIKAFGAVVIIDFELVSSLRHIKVQNVS